MQRFLDSLLRKRSQRQRRRQSLVVRASLPSTALQPAVKPKLNDLPALKQCAMPGVSKSLPPSPSSRTDVGSEVSTWAVHSDTYQHAVLVDDALAEDVERAHSASPSLTLSASRVHLSGLSLMSDSDASPVDGKRRSKFEYDGHALPALAQQVRVRRKPVADKPLQPTLPGAVHGE